MLIPENYIYFLIFLPDHGEKSFFSYLNQLIETIEHNWNLDSDTNVGRSNSKTEYVTLNLSYTKQQFYKHYFEYMSQKTSNQEGYIVCDFWWAESAYFQIKLYITKNPHILCKIRPLSTKRQGYKSFLIQEVGKGLIDYLMIGEVEDGDNIQKHTIVGKSQWVYLWEKIQLINLKYPHTQTQQALPEKRTPAYNLSKKIAKVFFLLGMLTIEKVEELIPIILDILEPIEDDPQEYINLLSKYDNILLQAWGEKVFSTNLESLGLSLEQWLKVNS